MSDDTVADTAPAPEPVDQAPAAAVDPATVAAIAQAVAAALAPPPAPAPVTPTSIPAAPVDEAPAPKAFAPGSLAVHTYDHFGRETHQVLLVVGTYQVEIKDPRTGAVSTQDRVRFLTVGTAQETGDLPADASELLPADQFDWEDAA